MKQLLDTVKQSIFAPEFYAALLNRPFAFSIKYFLSLILSLAVLFTIVFSIPLISDANRLVHDTPKKFFEYFPDDFELTMKNGLLSSNVIEPYFFPDPIEFKEELVGAGIENIAVVDTITPFSLEQFNEYHTIVWIGEDQLAYRDNRNSVTIEPFNQQMNFVFNESLMRNFESKISPYYGLVGPIIVLGIFSIFSLTLLIHFFYLLFGAVFIFFLLKFMGVHASYSKSYQIGLHAITLPLLIDIGANILGLGFLHIPLLSTFLMLLVVYLNYQHFKPIVPHEAPAPVKALEVKAEPSSTEKDTQS